MKLVPMIKAELLKVRRSAILPILLVPVILVWSMAVINVELNFEMANTGVSPEGSFYAQSLLSFVGFMLPSLIIVWTVLLTQLEHTNQAMRNLLSLPIAQTGLGLAKFITLLILLAVEMLIMLAGYVVAAQLAAQFQHYPLMLELGYVSKTFCIMYLLTIPMTTFYWLLTAILKNPIVFTCISLITVIPIIMFANLSSWFLYPMCYPFIYLIEQQHLLAPALGEFSVTWHSVWPILIGLPIGLLICFLATYEKQQRKGITE